MSISLAEAVAGVPAQRRGDADLIDATHDSTAARPGWLFCAVPGRTADGHDFAPAAVAAGAGALLVERFLDLDVPQAQVASVRAAMGPVAAAIHRHPSRDLTVVGVTGTNGKTTTAYLVEAAFGAAGLGTGVVGTIAVRVHGESQPGVRTTPEATDLQRLLATMRTRGVDAVAIEVSSHGLDQRRVDGTRFRVAAFTNLSQDHLDYHGTLESYFAAKARLFTPGLADRAVVCVDDAWGRRLADATDLPTWTYGTADQADVRVVDVDADLEGTRARLVARDPAALGGRRAVALTTRLLGRHNALNAAAAYLVAVAAGTEPDAASAGIAACEGVPGRLERVEVGQPFAVLVDYAHSPDALAHAVAVARRLAGGRGRVHVVVGCGGDRDRGKRPAMGAIAARADRAVLTSDNPRSEDPEAIVAEVAAGAAEVPDATVVVEVDRRTAIAAALAGAAAGDVVLIAGKGHETGQEIAGRELPFDDRVVAAEELRRSGYDRAAVPR